MSLIPINNDESKLIARMAPNFHAFDFLKCFAAIKMVARIVTEHGWNYPHAAFANANNINAISSLLDIDFSNFVKTKDYVSLFYGIYNLLRDLSLREFVLHFCPSYFCQFDRSFDFIDKYESMGVSIEYQCLILIFQKVEFLKRARSDDFDVNLSTLHGYLNNTLSGYLNKIGSENGMDEKEMRHLMDELRRCANTYSFSYKNIKHGAAEEAHRIFAKYRCTSEYEISVYGTVREDLIHDFAGRHRKWNKEIYDPAHYMRKLRGNEPRIDYLGMDSAINDAAKIIGNIERPTDFLEAVLVSPLNNDSKIEIGFVLSNFTDSIESEDSVLVVNPSPDLLIEYPSTLLGQTTFLVPYRVMAWVLQHQFPKTSFIVEEDLILDADVKKHFNKILFFSRNLSDSKVENLLSLLPVHLNPQAVMLAVLPTTMLNYRLEHEPFLFDTFSISQIDLFPLGAFISSPRKKALVKLRRGIRCETVELMSHDFRAGTFLIRAREEPVNINYRVLCNRNKSLYIIYQQESSGRDKLISHRNPPCCFTFSPEIKFWFTVSESPKTFGYKVEAYVCHYPTEKERIRSIFDRGKKIKSAYASISKFESGQFIEDWCENVLPYNKRIHDGVVEAINTAKSKGISLSVSNTISLKTLWYYFLDPSATQTPESILEREMFTSSLGELCAEASADELKEAMDAFCCEMSRDQETLSWFCLNRLLEKGLSKEFILKNQIEDHFNETYKDQSKDRVGDVRNALAKKTFRLEEERSLLKFLYTKIPESGDYLAVLIRFFTGLEPNIVCALNWEDIHHISYTDVYQFWIYRQFRNDGYEPIPLERGEDYRRIPISKTLYDKLMERKKQILSKTEWDEKQLRNKQIIATDDQLLNENTKLVNPRRVNYISRNAVKKIGIPEYVVDLPEYGDGTKETNLTFYRGDIFRTNFHYRANFQCGFTDSEIRYVLGLKQTTPFGKNYCDYLNSFSQVAMYQKLYRWDVLLHDGIGDAIPKSKQIRLEDEITLQIKDAKLKAVLEIPVHEDEWYDVIIENNNGFSLQVNMIPTLTKEGVDND